jgi:heme/copper-type cytochrome/quinol oxidase subunit 2
MKRSAFTKQENIIGLAVGALVILDVVAAIVVYRKGMLSPVPTGSGENASSTQLIKTRGPVPTKLIIPGKGSSTAEVPPNVAIPTVDAPTRGRTDSHFRVFEMRVEGGRFTPNIINVNRGDILRFKITAVDADYDITQPDYGLERSLPKGTTVKIEFGHADGGSFLFYCARCGGPEKGPTGWLNVAQK